jgi:hypothetical protein
VTVTAHTVIPLAALDPTWQLYQHVFEDVNRRAAQRHLLTYPEYVDVAQDLRIRKYVASLDGTPVGLATITNQLQAWPLISPEFFADRFPDHYRRHAVWYIGYVGVAATPTGRPRPHTFTQLITAMYPQVADSDGIAVMDFCGYNIDVRNLPRVAGLILHRLNPQVTHTVLDREEFHAYRFDGVAPVGAAQPGW